MDTQLRPDDDLVRTIAQLTAADGVAISIRTADGGWRTAATGRVPLAWGARDSWVAPTSVTPVVDVAGARIGNVLTFGGPLPTASVRASLATLAMLLASGAAPPGAPTPAGPTPAAPTPAAGVHVVVVDSLGRLAAVSPHVIRLLAYPEAEVIGRDVLSVIHESDHAATLDSLLRMSTARGERYPTDVRFVRPDRTTCVLEVLAIDPADTAATDLVFLLRETASRAGADAVVSDQARLLAMVGRGATGGRPARRDRTVRRAPHRRHRRVRAHRGRRAPTRRSQTPPGSDPRGPRRGTGGRPGDHRRPRCSQWLHDRLR